jgi:hypothetical protein
VEKYSRAVQATDDNIVTPRALCMPGVSASSLSEQYHSYVATCSNSYRYKRAFLAALCTESLPCILERRVSNSCTERRRELDQQ